MIKVMLHRAQVSQLNQVYPSQEIDVRMDDRGVLRLAHDLGTRSSMMKFKDYLVGKKITELAVNVKEDDLIAPCHDLLKKTGIDYFFFDMSYPQYYYAKKLGMPLATRASETEVPDPAAKRIWLDCFTGDYSLIFNYFNIEGKQIYLISPELHKFPLTDEFIRVIKELGPNLTVCTDYPARWLK